MKGGCFTGTCTIQPGANSSNSGAAVNLSSLSTYTAAGWSITATPSGTSTVPSGSWFIFNGQTMPLLLSENITTIYNAHQLQLMGATLGATYTLENNINLASSLSNNNDVWGGSKGTGFAPIGAVGANFTGTFNGNSDTVSNLSIDLPSTSNVGFFGSTSGSGTVENLMLTNVNVTGSGNVGGLAGDSGDTVSGVFVSGTVTGSGTGIGGITGDNFGTITESANATTVTGSTDVGGVAGNTGSSSNINLSYNTGTVTATGNSGTPAAGGLVGNNANIITNTYNAGTVTCTTTGTASCGGLVGVNSGAISNSYSIGSGSTGIGATAFAGLVAITDNPGTVTNSYWDTQASGISSSFGGGTPETTSAMMNQSTFSGWNFSSVWNMASGGSYPFLRAFYSTAPLAVFGGSSAAQGATVKLAVNGVVTDSTTTSASGSYYLLEGQNNITGINTSIANGSNVLTYIDSGSVLGNAVFLTTGVGGSTNAALTQNTVTVGTANTATISNTNLATAAGSLSDPDILYSVASNNLTLGNATNSNVNLTTTASTTYNVNGNITPFSGGSSTITFNGPVTLSTNPTIDGNTGAITFNGSVTGASNALTLETVNSTGPATFNGTVNLGSLIIPAGNFSLALSGSSTTINNAVTFNNTNGVTLGGASGDVLTFDNGVTSTVSNTTVGGTINSNGQTLDLNAPELTVAANTILNSAGGALSIGPTDSSSPDTNSLSLTAGSGALSFNGDIGDNDPLASFSASVSGAGNNISLPSNITTSGSISFIASSGTISQTGGGSHWRSTDNQFCRRYHA